MPTWLGPVGEGADGPRLPGLPEHPEQLEVPSSPSCFSAKTIKTQKIYNKSVSGSIWEKRTKTKKGRKNRGWGLG